ncbi:MAG: putative toxin-antitoxin system toxin component, PIN family [Aquificae bacterium]|nr:putative toxin-antitoxin system toxin component, PIN family [Aquificota bacterium]
MGKRKSLKVVLDTNILVSALLFGGRLNFIHRAWKEGKIKPIFCEETLEEFVKVLHYPKFGLTDEEITYLVEIEVMPYAIVIEKHVDLEPSIISDKDDIKFLECALSGNADYLVSGDKALLNLGEFRGLKIIDANNLAKLLKTSF